MTRLLILSLAVGILLSCYVDCYSQLGAANELSFEKPAGWFEMNPNERKANFRKFEFTKEQLSKLLANEKATTVVAVFHRDDVTKTPGITPTIQVLLRPLRGSPTFDQFRSAFVRSLKASPGLEDYSIVGEPDNLEVSGMMSVTTNSRFVLTHRSKRYSIRARSYAIPRGDHFIQISMSGEDDDRWTEKEFTDFINSVKIAK